MVVARLQPSSRPHARRHHRCPSAITGSTKLMPSAERVRRVGVLMAAAADDPEYQARVVALLQRLRAAAEAGLSKVALLQEPIAASAKGLESYNLECTQSDEMLEAAYLAYTRVGDHKAALRVAKLGRVAAPTRSSIASGRTAFQIASSHRRLYAFSADHDRGGFRAILLHNDEDLAPSG